MDKIDKNSDLFRSIPVHSQKLGVKRGFFRSIPVHFFSDYEQDDAFPKNIRSLGKNGADCYSKNGHAVTVLTRQS